MQKRKVSSSFPSSRIAKTPGRFRHVEELALDHSSPMSFLILYRVLLCGFETLQLSRRSTCDTDIFSNAAISCSVKSRSMRNSLNFFNIPFISSFPMVMNILKVKIHHVKHFFFFFSIFLFLNIMIENRIVISFKWRKEN